MLALKLLFRARLLCSSGEAALESGGRARGSALALAGVSVAMFGWRANVYYAESVLPNVMNGMLIDPYNPVRAR